MSRGNYDGGGMGRHTDTERRREPQRVVLIIANAGTISERLIHALEGEFPSVVVEQVEHVGAALGVFSHPVSLILVDVTLLNEAEERSAELLLAHPQALTAVIEPHDQSLDASFIKVPESPLVRSVLPMNLRLDLWLSVIRLMLCGGEYLPPGLILRARKNGHSTALPSGNGGMSPRPRSDETRFAELTARELQILEMVSRGLQNKLIAAEFRLSEHTVKIHLHNIITKLGAHNRTEAAARFRSLKERH
ncbi:response regulator transcription factor [Sinorhizobium mexicanum]|uniref:Response regulator transcription factor n=1 Tax=Sinorhizobium mexicanum TaxID=375549 RepID=A0A859R2J2_9HYPH|nr:response regulator transcription factor [Sinorhizobium mexicanum]MBP1887317.1 DNA-binding NarL/FixJ family response regulator [Sinorhizobium mexicanum]QLL65799.1 response regulator transcription factor [Sinorhizobium mexicanum]